MEAPSLFEIREEMLSSVAEKYERNEKSLKEDIQFLKNWIKTQPHLPEILDDNRIQNFLILNKCRIEKTKKSIDMYYTLRSKIPDLFKNINPKSREIKQTMEAEAFVPFPKLTDEMYRVMLYKTHNKHLVDEMDPFPVIGLALNLEEIRLKEDIMFGDIFIFDMEGITFRYLVKLTPSFLAKTFAAYEQIYSIPLKKLYLINAPHFVHTLMVIMKKILKPKIFERIQVCENSSILRKTLPEDILPRDYGGTERSVEELHELLKIKLKQYEDRFDLLDQLRVDESLRPELENDEILGFYGNFKQLDVD